MTKPENTPIDHSINRLKAIIARCDVIGAGYDEDSIADNCEEVLAWTEAENSKRRALLSAEDRARIEEDVGDYDEDLWTIRALCATTAHLMGVALSYRASAMDWDWEER